ncbi:MAG: hypothetical protein ACQESE_03205 [Nanobdellota archaeon]
MRSNKNAQLETEFIILLIMGFFILFTILAILITVSDTKREEQFYYEINDLGKSVQQELLLAGQVDDGYIREFYLPQRIDSKIYNVYTGNTSKSQSYIIFSFDNQEIFFVIPKIEGVIATGTNTIMKRNGTLIVSQ